MPQTEVSLDPREALATQPMSLRQAIVVAITVCLTALDGLDVLAISFASPGIAREWGIDRAALGVVLSMELLGMSAGSIVLGNVADRVGRRPTLLACLLVMAIGMAMAGSATTVSALSAWRVVTGLGIGGVLAASTATAAEFSNARRRDLCVALMAVGYPVGAIAGGAVIAVLLKSHSWRIVFEFGAFATAAFVPIVWIFVPESLGWLCQAQPAGALAKINLTLAQLGRAAIASLPAQASIRKAGAIRAVFAGGMARSAVLVTLAYFLHITTFYFVLKWIPKIVVDMGFHPSSAAGVLVWANVGGATGGLVVGLLTQRLSVKVVAILMLCLSTVMVAFFGQSKPTLEHLSAASAIAGFCTNGGVVGLYAVFARTFPTSLRASGTGFALGVGRGGAILAPILAGVMFQAGQKLPVVALVMGIGSLLAAVCLGLLRLRPANHE